MADLDDEIQARIDAAVAAATAPLLAEIAALKSVDAQDAQDDAELAALDVVVRAQGLSAVATVARLQAKLTAMLRTSDVDQ